MDLRPDQHRSLFHKGRRRDFLVHVGALDASALSLGSADATGLAFLFEIALVNIFLLAAILAYIPRL